MLLKIVNLISVMWYNTIGEMKADVDFIQIKTPITRLVYREHENVKIQPNETQMFNILRKEVKLEKYDHFFILIKLGEQNNYISDLDWAGYGGTEYEEHSYSVIRLPDNDYYESWLYSNDKIKYPGYVYIHEFLHTMETNSLQYNLYMPQIHDYEDFGYTFYSYDWTEDEHRWLKDVIQINVDYNGKKVGVNPALWKLRPTKFSYLRN